MAARSRRRSLQDVRSPFGVLLLCFFLSGATALVYEVVWIRMLGLVFGHTVYALTTVLAAFMAGLGLGSVVFGRRAAWFPDPIRAYGLLEIGIGITCALMPVLIWLASFAYLGLYRALGGSHAALGLVQFALLFALLLVPTALMGGTLPVLSQALARHEDRMERTVGVLYAGNTLGAVTGVLLAGYGLLPAVGNRGTLWIAAAANVIVGIVAIAYSRSCRPVEPRASRPAAGSTPFTAPARAEAPDHGPWLIAVALGISGAVAMLYEVTWTRALALVIGSSTYALTAMLAAFLLGIAGGAALYSFRRRNRLDAQTTFALIQGGIGVAAVVVLLAFDRLPALFLLAVGRSLAPAFISLVQLVMSVLVMLPTTLLLGATFPCAVAACAREPARIGRDVGRLYGVNTAGAILGAVLAGLVLVPALGVHAAVKAGIVVNLALAALLCAAWRRPVTGWRLGVGGVSLAAAAAVIFLPRWDTQLMSTGPAVYAQAYLAQSRVADLGAALRTEQLLFYRDGPSATVSVTRSGDRFSLRVNGKVDASTEEADMPNQVMLGHLPLLLHPEPRSVLVIGLGSGITAGAAARYPIERLDVVEIEPAVVEASRFFARDNGGVLKDSRLRLTITDARNYLLTTTRSYDVIISEPSNPWIGGIAALFSREFFDLARQRLAPGGMMAQWLQAYSLSPPDFQMVVKTFASVFPGTSIWHTTTGDYILLGRTEPAPIDLERLKARIESRPAVREDLDRLEVPGWAGVLGYFMLGEADARRYAGQASLNTDDGLPLEFSAPRALYLNTAAANLAALRRFRSAELPDITPDTRKEIETASARCAMGTVYLARGAVPEALAQFQRALALDPSYTPALVGSAKAALREDRYADAYTAAQQALAREPRNVEALLVAGVALMGRNAFAEARQLFDQAVTLRPELRGQLPQALAKLAPGGIRVRR